MKISDIKNKITSTFGKLKEKLSYIYNNIKKYINDTKEEMANNEKEENRIYILVTASIFLFIYIMFSYHIDKNIFNIFPSIPLLEDKTTINIYIPSEGCKEILTEKREIYSKLKDESLIKRLFELVCAGSYFENTSENVPVDFLIKTIWIADEKNGEGKICVIDLSPIMLDKDIVVVKGSEQMFKDALEKTITSNMPEIKKVILLEKGVPFRKLWEM
ncbi:MAG: GerMN domain-containing protein [Spirochaetes bacterium]|nr:GerMN domain-containing protein [Spirochaetota bacterium]